MLSYRILNKLYFQNNKNTKKKFIKAPTSLFYKLHKSHATFFLKSLFRVFIVTFQFSGL